jgi:heme exporter protein D
MWEALAAMTLICVMILVVYQVIERKFREKHV